MRPSERSLPPFLAGTLLITIAAAATLAFSVLFGSVILTPSAQGLTGSQATMVSSGDMVGWWLLDGLSVEEYNEGTLPGDPIALDLTFRGGGATLLIRAQGLTPNTPTDETRVVFSLDAATFFSEPGQCTVELASVEHVVLEPSAVRRGPPQGTPIPGYIGSVTCVDVTAPVSGVTVSIEADFQYRPEDSLLA